MFYIYIGTRRGIAFLEHPPGSFVIRLNGANMLGQAVGPSEAPNEWASSLAHKRLVATPALLRSYTIIESRHTHQLHNHNGPVLIRGIMGLLHVYVIAHKERNSP